MSPSRRSSAATTHTTRVSDGTDAAAPPVVRRSRRQTKRTEFFVNEQAKTMLMDTHEMIPDEDDNNDEQVVTMDVTMDDKQQDEGKAVPVTPASSVTTMRMTRSRAAKKRITTTATSEDTTTKRKKGDDEEYKEEYQSDYESCDSDDDDDDEFIIQLKTKLQPAAAVTPSPTKRTTKQKNSDDNKEDVTETTGGMSTSISTDENEGEATPVPSATPKKKKKSPTKKGFSPKKKSPTKGNVASSTTKSTKTIAARGLPRGALAKCNISGLTIRSLDGIKPLVAMATEDDEKGDNHACSNMLDSNSFLPGRLLVVSAPDPLTTVVGTTFDSGENLYKAMEENLDKSDAVFSIPLINYSLEPTADPTFTSWEFTRARLEAAGLVPSADNDEKGDFDDEDVSDEKDRGPVVVMIDYHDGKAPKVTAKRVCRCVDILDNSLSSALSEYQWAIIENGHGEEIPSVLVAAPESLLEVNYASMETQDDSTTVVMATGKDLLPPPSKKVADIKLPASLLEKSIRRAAGSSDFGICTISPLLDAATSLLLDSKIRREPGATLAFLKTVWGCMLVDAAPFDDAEDCLGLPALLLLSLVAKADPEWMLPAPLRRLAVAAALRTATAPSNQWVGCVRRHETWWHLEDMPEPTDEVDDEISPLSTPRVVQFRNILRAAQIAVGGRVAWGKWSSFVGDTSAGAAIAYLNDRDWDGSDLPPAPAPLDDSENAILDAWEKGRPRKVPSELRLKNLDHECRLASVDPNAMPHTLVLLQAILQRPPTEWKKHSLPALSRHVRKLIVNVNPRDQENVQLARMATWGAKKKTTTTKLTQQQKKQQAQAKLVKSFKEVVTNTGELSEKEAEVVDCYEAIQKAHLKALQPQEQPPAAHNGANMSFVADQVESFPTPRRVQAGKPLTTFEGRVAFLLAFASAVEVQVSPDGSDARKEVVSAMFCGDPDEPLLVQRIGKARREGKELAGGSTSGATAVPSLGYVQRARSKEEAELMEAAELEVAKHWHGGKTAALPLPAAGTQWELGNQNPVSGAYDWQQAEKSVKRTAEFVDDGDGKKTWRFTVGGIEVKPFDARAVVSPCALDMNDPFIKAVPITGLNEWRLLRVALYLEESSGIPAHGSEVLESISGLHDVAAASRESPTSEGLVYDWLPLANQSPVPSRTWRDVLLAVRCRESDFVVLGKGLRSDGSGTPGDMTEGVLLRLFHALEALYPTVIRKDGAFKFFIRPRGGAFYHLLACLELLGRGESVEATVNKATRVAANVVKKQSKRSAPVSNDESKPEQVTKRPRRAAASTRRASNEGTATAITQRPRRAAASAALKRTANLLEDNGNEPAANPAGKRDEDSYVMDISSDDEDEVLAKDAREAGDFLPVPRVTTSLWPHQEASSSKVVHGVKQGKRGHADASAVGAGKTLTALATIVRLAQWLEDTGRSRHGVLVMLPTKALIKEWLLEIATHTEGFHVIEQREDGTLFSLTYGKTNPPIDGNSIVISTLDRVCRRPFVRQAAWDFVVIDECLSVQNAAAKRAPSAWRQIEVSQAGVLMLSATFFRSKYDALFYMIRMLRSPLPRTIEWLPATIHEHIVCQVPETNRTWSMEAEMVKLPAKDLSAYRARIDAFGRLQLNDPANVDGRKLWTALEAFVRKHYEGRESGGYGYGAKSIMGDAFVNVAKKLLRKKRRPLVFADTEPEATLVLAMMKKAGIDARMWKDVAVERIASSSTKKKSNSNNNSVIVAVKTVEGQGINMQHNADCIICRPTSGDHLEQMKGRIDRPGQLSKELLLVVLVAEHTIEEAKYSNIRLAGNFFRQYIAPVAQKYRERVDFEAVMAAGGKKKLAKGTVSKKWREALGEAGSSGTFAAISETGATSDEMDARSNDDDLDMVTVSIESPAESDDDGDKAHHKPLNKVKVNKGDPAAVKQAKARAKNGFASLAVRQWLFPPKRGAKTPSKTEKKKGETKAIPKVSLLRFSDVTPPPNP